MPAGHTGVDRCTPQVSSRAEGQKPSIEPGISAGYCVTYIDWGWISSGLDATVSISPQRCALGVVQSQTFPTRLHTFTYVLACLYETHG